jgi:four helix bundle protein
MAGSSNVLKQKSYKFAIRVVNLYKHLVADFKEYILSKQVLRSGTSIGANVAEANQAQSDPDFISKLSIALKETVETIYWLELLKDTNYITEAQAESLLQDCTELKAILTASIKTKKRNTVAKGT